MKTEPASNILGSTMHELVSIALSDIRSCIIDDNIHINMDHWVRRQSPSVCTVCLAGAVMLKTLHQEEFSLLSRFDRAKMDALDAIRKGDIVRATRIFYYDKDIKVYHDLEKRAQHIVKTMKIENVITNQKLFSGYISHYVQPAIIVYLEELIALLKENDL